MKQEHFDVLPPVLGTPCRGLADVDFPDESALSAAINEAQTTADRRAERLAHAVQGAVSAWLKGQQVDPEHPPEHWGAAPPSSKLHQLSSTDTV